MVELEKEIIATLLFKPGWIEAVEICDGLFSDEYRKLFSALNDFWEEKRQEQIDFYYLAQKTGFPISRISSLIDHKLILPSIEILKDRITQFKRQRFCRKLVDTLKEAIDSYEKTGIWSEEKFLEIGHEIEMVLDQEKQKISELENFQSHHIEWLWRGRVPLGMVSLLIGDPGAGKSFLSQWLAAKLSRGGELPDHGPIEPAGVLIIDAEDPPELIRPRVEANGGNLAKIFIHDPDKLCLQEINGLINFIKENNIKLIILDPLNAFLGRTDYLKDPAVRGALRPIVNLAARLNIAILCISHLNKKEDSAAIYRIGGSIAFAGIARSILSVVRDEDDPDRRLLMPLKISYGKKPESLAFRIQDNLTLKFEENPIKAEAEILLDRRKREEAKERSWVDDWLREVLKDGPVSNKEIHDLAKENQISNSALYRAKNRLGIIVKTKGYGKNKVSLWELNNFL